MSYRTQGIVAFLAWLITSVIPYVAQAEEAVTPVEEDGYEATLERIAVEEYKAPLIYFSYDTDCSGQKPEPGGPQPVNPGIPSIPQENIFQQNPVNPRPPVVGPTPGNPGTPKPPMGPGVPGGPGVSPLPTYPGYRPGYGYGELDQIVNAGLRIWSFIRDNSPTVTARRSYAHALPAGIQCWNQLEGWQIPRSEVYRLTLKGKYTKRDAIIFEFRLLYQWGGNIDEIGQYLANVTVGYRKIHADFGTYSVDADVEVGLATNVGTRDAPVAGLPITVIWDVKTSNHDHGEEAFFVFGDGRPSVQLE